MVGQPPMSRVTATCSARVTTIVALAILFLVSFPAAAQQTYVTKYDLYTGYAFLNSPKIGLFENGFHTQFGLRPKPWLSFGIDYSITAGDLTFTPDLLPTALQQQLGAQLAHLIALGVIPPNYTLSVPAHSVTHSFAIGPQLAYRHFSKATFFVRPSVGAIREGATPRPKDPIAAGIVAQLAPAGHKTDWQGFYGIGGGFDILFTKHFALRTQADYVWDHLFNDLLRDGRWTTRFSIGPCFNFGRNIMEKKTAQSKPAKK
jgi:hypothetical protein